MQLSETKIDEVEIRSLETKAQWDWFNNCKHKVDEYSFLCLYAGMRHGSRSIKAGWELIEAGGQIWFVKPDDNFKEIFGLNPVKSGTTHQHLAQEEGEGSNKVSEHDTESPYEEAVRKVMKEIYMNCVHGQVGGRPDRFPTHKNHFAFDDEGNYEGLTEAKQKSISDAIEKLFEAAMKQGIDKKKANDQHVLDIPESPDRSNKKEQANDGLYKLCEIGLPNTVSLMGSNPPPWATTPASQGLSGFSSAANAVGYVGTTAALSLRYTKPRAARIFANIGPISCAWGVIMGLTSYLPGEFQWVGYVFAVFCTLMVLLANY